MDLVTRKLNLAEERVLANYTEEEKIIWAWLSQNLGQKLEDPRVARIA